MAQKIKEEYSQILPSHKDFQELMSKKDIDKKEYILPDGNIVELGNEIYEIPEAIFNPNIFEIETKNLPEIILDSISKCDISTRKELYNNIVLGGGNTFIKGFESRLKSEIEEIKKRNCGIVSLKERNYSAWIGASGISSMSNFNNKWVSRNEYFEYGGKLFERDYLFNYDGLDDGQRKKITSKEIGTAEIYKKLIMNE
jgi:actin-related protein